MMKRMCDVGELVQLPSTAAGMELTNDRICIGHRRLLSAKACGRRGVLSFFLLAACLLAPVFVEAQESVKVSTPQELRAALLAGETNVTVTANLNFNLQNWPDPPVRITKQVAIFSLYRVKLDFCGSNGEPARPLINVTAPGSLLLQKVFLRNFLPSVPQNLSGLGPVPALLSSGGIISFRVVVFHFLPAVKWVFDAPPAESFWAREGRKALTSIYTGQPVQLEDPALYLVTYSSPPGDLARYSISICYSPMDLHGCYSDNAEDTTLIYCLYTFADSLRNDAVRNVRVFHDVGLDRLAYSRFRPIVVDHPKSYSACPGSRPSINMENLYAAVMIRDAVDFSGLRFKSSLPTNYTFWPPNMPLLLSLFDVSGTGVLSLDDVIVDVPELGSTVEKLLSLPENNNAGADPTLPHLRPVVDTWPTAEALTSAAALATLPVLANGTGGVIYDAWHPDCGMGGTGAGDSWPGFWIQRWVLEGNAWQQYAAGALNAYEALSAPAAAAWRFTDVFVRQADNANLRALCFSGALEQGSVMPSGVAVVQNQLQLRAALAAGRRFVQVVSDITLTREAWPTGDAALVVDAAIVEVRGCHPQYGKRFTIDLSDLMAVVRIKGRLIFQGDLRFVGVGWTKVQPSQMLSMASGAIEVSTLGAFALASNGQGAVECEGVVIEAEFDPDGAFRPVDLFAVLHLNHMTPAIRAYNASLRDDRGISLGFWCELQSNPPGTWAFTNTDIYWTPVSGSDAAAGGGGNASTAATGGGSGGSGGSGGGSGSGGVPLEIIIPCVVGGFVLLAVVPLAVLLMRGRAKRRLAGDASRSRFDDLTAAPGSRRADSKAAMGLSGSIPDALALAQSSGGDGTDSEGASALAAVLQAAGKIINSNGNSNGSASMTRTDMSALAAAAAAAMGYRRLDKDKDRGAGGHGHGALRGDALENRHNGPLCDINAAKREIVSGRNLPNTGGWSAALDDLVLQAVLGEGSYGRVYRALWRGTTVAVKVILLPAHMGGRERHERMAVMEAAISSSLSHPNIVQTFTYVVECVEGAKARAMHLPGSRGASALPEASTCPGSPAGHAGGGGPPISGGLQEGAGEGAGDRAADIVGWEIRLVQEFCDLGSLRDKLNARAFFVPMPTSGGVQLSRPQSPIRPPQSSQSAAAAALRNPLLPIPTVPVIKEEGEAEAEGDEAHNEGEREVRVVASTGQAKATADAAAAPMALRPAVAAATTRSTARSAMRGGGSMSEPTGTYIENGGGEDGGGAADGGGGGAAAADGEQADSPQQMMIVDLAAVLDTAIDVARALAHLHREGIVHADLKPRNVLLKGSTTDPRGFVAKVADFGLSMRLDPNETHVSNAYHGTLAYMAPETLLHGHVSRASDVYGFGILLYELYTGDTAFRGVPKALIGHAVTKDNLRPVFPPSLGAPFEYQLLACRCWESNPEIRPEFDFILEDLKRMRARLCATTRDESSLGGPGGGSSNRTGTAGGATAGFAEPAVWGLPGAMSQRPSTQAMNQNPLGPNSHLRGGGVDGYGGGGFTDGDRSLSASNSVTMSSIGGALTGQHNTASTIATACGGSGGGSSAARHQIAAGGSRGSAAVARTVPDPACLDVPTEAVDEAAEEEEKVRSL